LLGCVFSATDELLRKFTIEILTKHSAKRSKLRVVFSKNFVAVRF
jgi:hypothetical protein